MLNHDAKNKECLKSEFIFWWHGILLVSNSEGDFRYNGVMGCMGADRPECFSTQS